MSEILFPTEIIIDLSDLDLEMMQHYTKQWDLEHCQMEKGIYSGSIFAVHTPHIQLGSANYSHGFMSRGSFPSGTVLLLYISTPATVNFQNKLVDKHELIVLKEGDEIDYMANGENKTLTIAIEKGLLYSAFEDYFGESIDVVLKNKRFIINTQKIDTFLAGVSYWKDYLKSEVFQKSVDTSYDEIETKILHHIFSCLHVDEKYKERKKFKIDRVRELLDAHIDTPINMYQLSQELGVSERQLHNAFKLSYGLTPKNYLQNLRLNRTRKELLTRKPGNTTVSAIAYKYNFIHTSDFTKKYKQMFGELPSLTLHK